MPAVHPLTEVELDALRQFDTCMIANAVETFNVRLRNTGFTSGNIRCIFPDAPPIVGYAVTARLSSGEPPIAGSTFHDRGDLWKFLLQSPAPRILVLQDMDDPPGRGAFIGDMHAAVLELSSIHSIGLKLFAGNVSVSHAYAHICDLGAAVTIDGMEVHSGDLLHGDRHGILSVPQDIAISLPEVAARLQRIERKE